MGGPRGGKFPSYKVQTREERKIGTSAKAVYYVSPAAFIRAFVSVKVGGYRMAGCPCKHHEIPAIFPFFISPI